MTPELAINNIKLPKINNGFNRELRKKFFDSSPFIKEYTSNYEPIFLQEKNQEDKVEKLEEKMERNQHKKHYIKQKQSQANLRLKRSYGVSYVKPTESKQDNIGNIYDKLTPIAIQCSNSISNIEEATPYCEDLLEKVLYKFDEKNP